MVAIAQLVERKASDQMRVGSRFDSENMAMCQQFTREL